MLARRPVVQANDSSDNLAIEAGCGIAVPPDAPAALAQAILTLSRMSADERRTLGENGRRFVLQHHDYCVLAARFLQAWSRSGTVDGFGLVSLRGGPDPDLGPSATQPFGPS